MSQIQNTKNSICSERVGVPCNGCFLWTHALPEEDKKEDVTKGPELCVLASGEVRGHALREEISKLLF